MDTLPKDAFELGVTDTNGDTRDAEWNHHDSTFKSTSADAANMRRMGKQQKLVRQFRVLSMASFVAISTSAWELTVFNVSSGVTNGGLPMLVYAIMWNFVGFFPIYLSMAEMASMAPVAGAQYHWVSEFAPESLQRGLSYLTGWTSTLAWQAGNAQGVFMAGTLVQILISLHDEMYPFTQWHTSLLAMAAILIAFIGNTLGSRVLHLWQNVVFVVHVIVFICCVVPIWVNAPRATNSQVWSEFTWSGGWQTTGLAVMVGQQVGIFTQIGVDTAAHMSEEVRDASKAVPKAMISIWLCNSVMAFICLITIAYHLPEVDKALADPSTYPIIYILRQSMSKEWMTVLLTFMLVLLICGNMTYLAAVTRDIWAFASDQGLPFSNWVGKVNQKRHIPVNAIAVTSCVATVLSLIYIGNTTAYFAMVSLVTVALLQCYSLSIGCMLWRRIAKPDTLPPAKFSLGKWGIPINAAAVMYSFYAFFWAFWPMSTPTNPEIFNWACVLFVGTLVIAAVHFVFVARHKYFGPVTRVQGRQMKGRSR